jgi:hypothetical protein
VLAGRTNLLLVWRWGRKSTTGSIPFPTDGGGVAVCAFRSAPQIDAAPGGEGEGGLHADPLESTYGASDAGSDWRNGIAGHGRGSAPMTTMMGRPGNVGINRPSAHQLAGIARTVHAL